MQARPSGGARKVRGAQTRVLRLAAEFIISIINRTADLPIYGNEVGVTG